MSAAWKDLERRICRQLGGRRGGPTGAAVSDCVNVPFATEIKRSKRRAVLARWLEQAEAQGKREGKPWALVVAGHNDRSPVAVISFTTLVDLAQRAGLIPETDASAECRVIERDRKRERSLPTLTRAHEPHE